MSARLYFSNLSEPEAMRARLSSVLGCRLSERAALRFAAACSEAAPAPYEGPRPVVFRPHEVWRLLAMMGKLRQERLVALYLDAQNGLLERPRTISLGSLNITRTHPREIFWPAIGCGAHALILAHNHPSGCLDPSDEDVAFTQGVKRAADLLGVDLYDHVIVARGGYTSLRERGLL